jgi:hypothetical protein
MTLHRRPSARRWSSKRKVSVVLELLLGADLESTSRKYRVTAATLTEWGDRFSGRRGGDFKAYPPRLYVEAGLPEATSPVQELVLQVGCTFTGRV